MPPTSAMISLKLVSSRSRRPCSLVPSQRATGVDANRDRIDAVNERLSTFETGVSERLTRIETLLEERLPERR